MIAEQQKVMGTKLGKRAIVLGNGPSVKLISPDLVQSIPEDLEVFVVNDYPLSELAKCLIPTYLVLSDPENHPNSCLERNIKIWEWIQRNPEVKLVLPLDWYLVMQQKNYKNEVLLFDDSTLVGLSKNIKPTKPRGYMSFTAFKAISQAQYLGYSEIGILGIDNTMFEKIAVDQNLNLIQGMNHFLDYGDEQHFAKFYPNGIGDYFLDVSLGFLEAHKFKSPNTFNLNPTGLYDAFQKKELSDFINYSQS